MISSAPSDKLIERVRDPVHDLIEFDMNSQLERVLWESLETQPLQRLRRVRQLGFSDLVFPGATHSRLMHSLGVFHTARNLMTIVRAHGGRRDEYREECALAASLLHDVGHGPFSHTFERVGSRLDPSFKGHEDTTVKLIKETEIAEKLATKGSGFPNDVAEMISGPGHPYTDGSQRNSIKPIRC